MATNLSVTEAFMVRYLRELDYFERVAQACARQCETHLEQYGIRAITTWRAKRPDRLRDKLTKRNKKKDYQNTDEIYNDIPDLAGVRIALYFPGDGRLIDSILKREFSILEERTFPATAEKPALDKRFSGYWAKHYRIQLLEKSLADQEKRYAAARIEIQVASVLMHGWSEVEHDLVYKPQGSQLPADALAILDQLNGLVITGESLLVRLQNTLTTHKNKDDQNNRLTNHYDLASYLLKTKSNTNPANIGRVDVAYRFLQLAGLTHVHAIQEHALKTRDTINSPPLSQQLVDSILRANPKLTSNYLRADRELSLRSPYETPKKQEREPIHEDLFSTFFNQWTALKALLSQIAESTGQKNGIASDFASILTQAQLDPINISSSYQRARAVKNRLLDPRLTQKEKVSPAELMETINLIEQIRSEIYTQAKSSNLMAVLDAFIESPLNRPKQPPTLPQSKSTHFYTDSSGSVTIELGQTYYAKDAHSILLLAMLANRGSTTRVIRRIRITHKNTTYLPSPFPPGHNLDDLVEFSPANHELPPQSNSTGIWHFGPAPAPTGGPVKLDLALDHVHVTFDIEGSDPISGVSIIKTV